jgi:hypothetical protein
MAQMFPDAQLEVGEHARCPHCRGITRVEPHPTKRWVCAACGGPRIPLAKGATLSEDVAEPLRRSAEAAGLALGARLAAGASAFVALLGVGLGAVLALASVLAAVGAVVVGAAVAFVALRFRRRARGFAADAERELDVAWERAVEAMLRRGGERTPAALAKELRIPEALVEELVARLSADDKARIEVGDDAELHVASMAPPVRVEVGDDAGRDTEAEAQAEAEAAQADDAVSEASKKAADGGGTRP